jgi:hypothetical protein
MGSSDVVEEMDDRDGEDGILTAVCRPHQGNSLGQGNWVVLLFLLSSLSQQRMAEGRRLRVEGWELGVED